MGSSVEARSSSRAAGDFRRARVRCGFELRDVARELGVPPGDLRAVEWGRLDLLSNRRYAEKLVRRYEEWLAPDGVPRPVRVAPGPDH
jgi:cytoskeletal protein RodZ